MQLFRRLLRAILLGLVIGAGVFAYRYQAVATERIDEVRKRVKPDLQQELASSGFALGDPAFIRIFKETKELELWLQPKDSASFKLWNKWPVAAMSGKLGPKLKEGDNQAPEGFYEVPAKALNPKSSYHLSFNIGYPNARDLAHGSTGSFIMVHGSNVSIGCFAMTDPVIEQIYLVVEAAMQKGQSSVPVHVFPFRMTAERLASAVDSPWLDFWKTLLPPYESFEKSQSLPRISVQGGQYLLQGE
jgi:murein L,D-transpeptidase YafK